MMTDRQSELAGEAARLATQAEPNTRAALLAAAAALFADKGYAATSVSDIVGGAGLAQGTFYLYFKSKSEIITALSRQLYNQTLEEIIRRTAGVSSVVGRLHLGLDCALDTYESQAPLLRALAGATAECNDIRQQELIPLYADVLGSWLSEGSVSGELHCPQPRLVAHLLVTMVENAANNAVNLGVPAALPELRPVLWDLVRRMIGAA